MFVQKYFQFLVINIEKFCKDKELEACALRLDFLPLVTLQDKRLFHPTRNIPPLTNQPASVFPSRQHNNAFSLGKCR